MKVKLLRKVRKRFGWYVNSTGYYVLVDKKYEEYFIYDSAHIKSTFVNGHVLSEFEVSLNLMKRDIFSKLSVTYRANYRLALKNANSYLKNGR